VPASASIHPREHEQRGGVALGEGCLKCQAPLIFEDLVFADRLAAVGVQRRRFVCLSGHSIYDPLPTDSLPDEPTDDNRRRCASHDVPVPCAQCREARKGLFFEAATPKSCRHCGRVFIPDHNRRTYCVDCRDDPQLARETGVARAAVVEIGRVSG